MEIYYSYTKLRKEFGRHCAFHDEAGEVCSTVARANAQRCRGRPAVLSTPRVACQVGSRFLRDARRRLPTSRRTRRCRRSMLTACPARWLCKWGPSTPSTRRVRSSSRLPRPAAERALVAAAQANTQQIMHRTQGMSHTEGGWPKDVDCTEAEHVIRFRRKVEKDEDYVRSIISLGCQARCQG